MRHLISILTLLVATTLNGNATVIFSSFGQGGPTFAELSVTDTIVTIQVSSTELQSDADLSVTALLGSDGALVFSDIDYSHHSRPSPPFSLGGIDFPAQPSRALFSESFTVNQTQAGTLSELDFVTLSFPSGAEQVQLRLLNSVPEPSTVFLCSLAALAIWSRRP